MSKEVARILSSKNYEKFKNIKGNRVIRHNNFEQIKESMKQKVLLIPILVNEKMEIIDGQHRFEACKELGLPVNYYIVEGYGIEDVERANRASSNWTLADFLNSYILSEVDAYVRVGNILNEYPISVAEFIKILAKVKKRNSGNLTQEFKNKTMTLTENEEEEVKQFLTALTEFNFFKDYKRSRFVSAFYRLYTHPNYSAAQMSKKLENQTLKNCLVLCNTIEDYLVILANEIYSAKSARSNNNIYYDKDRNKLYTV